MSARFNQRLGFHYYPDTLHYCQDDLDACLPILQAMGAAWITLLAPAERAIPESFLGGLLAAGIQPVLHFASLTPGMPQPTGELELLLRSYARWGVRYAAFFDRPNRRAGWAPGVWAQGDLVERFLDSFCPLAALAGAEGLTPVFPPLEPGGDYWDLAFLRSALGALGRRTTPAARENLALSAYAWAGQHALDWGAGGPQRWPGLRPYQVQPVSQDQRGFRIFDWYLAIAQAELGFRPPVLLLRAGYCLPGDGGASQAGPGVLPVPAATAATVPLADRLRHARLNLALARNLAGEPGLPPVQAAEGAEPDPGLLFAEPLPALPPIPPEVLACNFWLLAAGPDQPAAGEAWIDSTGEALPVVEAFRRWAAYQRKQPAVPLHAPLVEPPQVAVGRQSQAAPIHKESCTRGAGPVPVCSEALLQSNRPDTPAAADGLLSELRWAFQDEAELAADWPAMQPPAAPAAARLSAVPGARRPISHYVLLPLYAWGAANWDLALIEPLLQDAHPTIGFSLAEARHAERVTVIAGEGAISTEALEMLRQSGCQVERILDDGTFVASGAVYPGSTPEENIL